MPTYTSKYELIKPDETDFYNIENFNDNADKIETAMLENKEIAEKALETAVAAQNPAYGSFLDDTQNATAGYWFKVFEACIPDESSPKFEMMVAVQDNSTVENGMYPSGIICASINIVSGVPIDCRINWLCASRKVESYSEEISLVLNASDSSNIKAAVYIYNSKIGRNLKVTPIAYGLAENSDSELQVTFYRHKGHSDAVSSIPSAYYKFGITASDYMYLLSSSIDSQDESGAATPKAVNDVYSYAKDVYSYAGEVLASSVQKTGDAMSDQLVILSSATTGEENGGIIVGRECSSSGKDNIVQGYNCAASGDYSVAMGRDSRAEALGAHAFGNDNKASGIWSTTMGEGNKATTYGSFCGGMSNTSNMQWQAIFGRLSKPTEISSETWNADGDSFIVGVGASGVRDNAFRVNNSGNVYAKTAFNQGGADYAEYFEWLDGNENEEDRIGYFVSLEDGKVRIANDSDRYILGAVSAVPGSVGNSFEDNWNGMYQRDRWGRFICEEITLPAEKEIIHHDEVKDEDGNIVSEAWDEEIEIMPERTEKRFVMNPDFNPNEEYVPRSKRKEWCVIGLLGRLKVFNDGSCVVGGYCKPNERGIATASEEGYPVLGVDDDIVEVFIK